MTLSLLFPPSLGPVTAGARAETLAGWLSNRLSRPIAVEVAESYRELAERLSRHQVDLAWAPPIVCARVVDKVPAIFLAVRNGTAKFRAALVVRRGEITSIAELRGKHAAWVDRQSAGGYLLPCTLLRAHGHVPDDFFNRQSFVRGYGDAVRKVIHREADVAPVFVTEPSEEAVERALASIVGTHAAAKLHTLAFTEATPADGFVVARGAQEGGIDVADIAALGESSEAGETNPLLEAMDAEALTLATADDYFALRGRG